MTGNEEKLAARVLQDLEEAGLGVYGLKARCLGSLLTLQGIVDVLAEKIHAEEIAGRTPGISRVENAITVCTDGSVDDEDVAMEVAEELAADPARAGVGAEVSGGCVKLVGQVSTAAVAASAIAAAAKARGVREVASELSLAPEAATDDPSLVNVIEASLAEILGAEARYIQPEAHHGVVRLTGMAAPETAAKAMKAVADVPGVRRVEDHLQPRLELHDRVITDIMARLAANPFLNEAPLSFIVRDGLLVAEGVVDGLKAKRDLERVLHEMHQAYRPDLRGIDNRVRVTR